MERVAFGFGRRPEIAIVAPAFITHVDDRKARRW
jgi:hypothetical protein